MPFEYKVVQETLDLIPQLTENGSFFPVRNHPDITVSIVGKKLMEVSNDVIKR